MDVTLCLSDNQKSNLSVSSPVQHDLQVRAPFQLIVNAGEKILLTSAFAGTFTMTCVRGEATYVETKLYEEFEVTIISGSPDCYLEFTVSNR